MVRTSGDPSALVNAIRNEVQAMDRRVPLYANQDDGPAHDMGVVGPNMAATLALAFGLVALVLSAVGLYSVMAYIVSQRTRGRHSHGLGATESHVLKLITGEGMKLAAIGVVVGFVLSLALARVLSSVLIGVSATT